MSLIYTNELTERINSCETQSDVDLSKDWRTKEVEGKRKQLEIL